MSPMQITAYGLMDCSVVFIGGLCVGALLMFWFLLSVLPDSKGS